MAENARLEDLRRRVQKDPASIAFAQLAEEYRRAGRHRESVDVCRAGLAIHPGYLSARVTLGRALLELNELDAARSEFETVLKGAPENLAAVRGLADVLHRSGALAEALAQYKTALGMARNDPDLEQTVADLTRQLAPKKGPMFDPDAPPVVVPAAAVPSVAAAPDAAPVAASVEPAKVEPAAIASPGISPSASDAIQPAPSDLAPAAAPDAAAAPLPPGGEPAPQPAPVDPAVPSTAQAQVKQTIEALEQWLDAIHVSRADRSS